MTTHKIAVGACSRVLPVREVKPGVSVALFNPLGDWELNEALGVALAPLIPAGTDVVLMPDGKAQATSAAKITLTCRGVVWRVARNLRCAGPLTRARTHGESADRRSQKGGEVCPWNFPWRRVKPLRVSSGEVVHEAACHQRSSRRVHDFDRYTRATAEARSQLHTHRNCTSEPSGVHLKVARPSTLGQTKPSRWRGRGVRGKPVVAPRVRLVKAVVLQGTHR
jgi:hypothetical protein